MKINFYDRHAEHADPNVPLCEHGQDFVLRVGDTFTGSINMGSEVLAEVEIVCKGKDRCDVIINQLEYLIAKAKRSL